VSVLVSAEATRGRAGTGLFLRLYALGIFTAIAFAGTWFAAHSLIRLDWPAGVKLALDDLRDIAARWEAGTLPAELERVRVAAGVQVSVYDLGGALVASNVQPPLPAPTAAGRQRVASGATKSMGNRPSLTALRRGDRLLGYCVFDPMLPRPPLWGVIMDLLIMSSWFSAVGLLVWRILVRPLRRITTAAESFGAGNMAARTGVDRDDEIGKLARSFDEMSERIARSREAERELLASLSHELRTPMARIRVALDLAAESDAETARASLIDVAEDLTELETLMSNIFSTTRLEMAALARDQQSVPLQRAQVEVAALVEKAVAHQRAQHPQRRYHLQINGSQPARCICADAIFIRRAIENVLENAHKYSPGDSAVDISVDQTDHAFRIVITDRGLGIRPGDLSQVFSPFFRADRSRTRATGGVGLGLALAKRVVEAHGGSISVASQVDVGTTVTFLLPISVAPQDDEPLRKLA
jgi:two-component system, OmpR family, sensor kinase